jgi:ATP-dependent 26S proteasome regulatory subunit
MSKPSMRPPNESDLSLQHLQAELTRIDLLIQREIMRWQAAGQNPADAFRGLHVGDGEAMQLLKRPFGTSWGQMVTLQPEEEKAFANALTEIKHQAQAFSESARRQGQTLRLEYLASTFNLDRFDLDAFLICLASTLDLRYERLYGFLQDDVTRKRPRVNLVLDLLCDPGPGRLTKLSRFAEDAPLFKHHLLARLPASSPDASPLLNQILSVDKAIIAWLLGDYQPHAEIGPHVTLQRPQQEDANGTLAEEMRANLMRAWSAGQPILAFYGPDQARQRTAAEWLAARAERPLLIVDLAAVKEAEVSPLRALRLTLRDARLTGALPYFAGWEACFATERSVAPPPGLLSELCAYPGTVLVASKAPWQAQGIARDRQLFWLEFAMPVYPQRCALWSHFLDGQPTEVTENLDVTALASQFLLTSGQIRDAVASAKDAAAQRGEALDNQDLFAAARAHSNPHLSGLARKIDPRYDWNDIVLPIDQLAILREIVATVRGRPQVLEEWGVGKKLVSSAGVTVLFGGPPGTGKTMAAEVIASELSLDLYKIDLSTVVSKYIGETEKNLERIFSEAQSSNAILFFDEADAIFGKRSEVKDAHDRYANIEVSYLLQRMEAYDGVTILATNLRANLDEAFTRRLQFAVDFPFPEKEDRQRIWETLFPPDVPREPEIDFGLLARRFKLAGGNIRNVIVSAAYLAASDGQEVTMQHLLHGTRRELQKMGRLVNEADMQVGSLDHRRQR